MAVYGADNRLTRGVRQAGSREHKRDERNDHRRRGQPPSHCACLGSRAVKRGGEARRTWLSSSSEISVTVESTASRATPESVSCSSSAVAVSSTVFQLRSSTT